MTWAVISNVALECYQESARCADHKKCYRSVHRCFAVKTGMGQIGNVTNFDVVSTLYEVDQDYLD